MSWELKVGEGVSYVESWSIYGIGKSLCKGLKKGRSLIFWGLGRIRVCRETRASDLLEKGGEEGRVRLYRVF